MISLKVHYFAIVKNAFHVKTLFITIYIIKVLLHIYTYEKKSKDVQNYSNIGTVDLLI